MTLRLSIPFFFLIAFFLTEICYNFAYLFLTFTKTGKIFFLLAKQKQTRKYVHHTLCFYIAIDAVDIIKYHVFSKRKSKLVVCVTGYFAGGFFFSRNMCLLARLCLVSPPCRAVFLHLARNI